MLDSMVTSCGMAMGMGVLQAWRCAHTKLYTLNCRAASALQEAAAEHKKRTGRPFVLIIDAVDRLAEHAPDILETLQVYMFSRM